MSRLDVEKMCRFALEMKQLRERFPELAREIDRCLYDAAQSQTGSCGHADCDCQMTFEQFHERQNRAHRTGKDAARFDVPIRF